MEDTSGSGEAKRVIEIITKAIRAIADHAEISRVESGGRTVPLLFPEGIGDIHVSVTVAGGVSIDVEISGGAAAPGGIKRVISRGSVHPMVVTHPKNGDGGVFVAIGHCEDGPFGKGVYVDDDNGPHPINPMTP